MYRDVEETLWRELRDVADHVTVPALPELPSAPPPRFAWQPLLVAAALVVVALATVAALLQLGGAQSPQPAPRPTGVVTDGAIEAEPPQLTTDPPSVPYLVDGVLHVSDRTFPGYEYLVGGTNTGWLAGRPDFWFWGNIGRPEPVSVAIAPPPSISTNGEYIAYITTEGEMNGFETDPAGEGMGLPVEVPVRDEDGVGTRTVVTDDGWVIGTGYGVGVLWRPYVVGADVVDLTETAPDQLVLQSTAAGLVVVDASDGARDATSGRVYLADLTGDGEISPIADLPNFGLLDAAGEWVAWVSTEVVGGDVMTYDEIQVRRIEGGDEGVLRPPDGWQFVNARFSFEDNQFLVARVTDGQRERMVRCSPALQECVLLDTP
jgi:hypothetical protein